MKTCFKCSQKKPLSEFYPHSQMGDGYLNKCKDCTKSDASARRLKKLNDIVWVIQERARCREKQSYYRLVGLASQPKKETRKKWYQNNKHKVRAQHQARQALKSGRLERPMTCSNCGKMTADLEMHHTDYSKPLDVQWLCTTCHGKTRWKLTLPDVSTIPTANAVEAVP